MKVKPQVTKKIRSAMKISTLPIIRLIIFQNYLAVLMGLSQALVVRQYPFDAHRDHRRPKSGVDDARVSEPIALSFFCANEHQSVRHQTPAQTQILRMSLLTS